MKYNNSVLLLVVVIGQLFISNYQTFKNIEPKIILIKSIDFMTERYFFDCDGEFFLQCDISSYSKQDSSFNYSLSEHFYYKQLVANNNSFFFRSNGVLVLIKTKDTSLFSNDYYPISDSLKKLFITENLCFTDSIIRRSDLHNEYYITYDNDTLKGVTDGFTNIIFNRLDITKD